MELVSCRFRGNVRHWSLLARRRFRPSVPWWFAVSESLARTSLWSCFGGMGAALWSWFLVGSEGNVKQWSLLARRRFRPSVPWCFLLFRNRPLELRCGAVDRQTDRQTLRHRQTDTGRQTDRQGFLSAQKATLGTGACLLGAASVLQCDGVLLFRNGSCTLELVSCRLRRQRQALEPAC